MYRLHIVTRKKNKKNYDEHLPKLSPLAQLHLSLHTGLYCTY